MVFGRGRGRGVGRIRSLDGTMKEASIPRIKIITNIRNNPKNFIVVLSDQLVESN